MAAFTLAEDASAILYPITANRKLAPVDMVANSTERLRPVPAGPFVASTYVSLEATCPGSCPFRNNGCYVTSGFYAPVARQLDENSKGKTPFQVIEEEALTIETWARKRHQGNRGVPKDGGKLGTSGRDLRLHVGGDVPDEAGARRLAKAAVIWRIYGGGRVWTYTHRWREIARDAWGEINVLASVETWQELEDAQAAGYVPSLVVTEFQSNSAWKEDDSTIIPCPAETSGVSCVKCRLCLDAPALAKRRAVIAFKAHGVHKSLVHDALEAKTVRRLTVVR